MKRHDDAGKVLRRWLSACALVAMALSALAGSAAAAGTWSGHQVSEASYYGVSCPTESRCVAVGANNAVATSASPVTGPWELSNIGAGAAGGPYVTVARQIRGIDCPELSFCVAVSYEGLVYTSHTPAGGPSAWTAADLSPVGPNWQLYGVSCPSAQMCVAVGSKGRIVTSTDPDGGVGAWTLTQLPESVELRGVSCSSAGLCVAVGPEGQIVSSDHPLAGAAAWHGTQLPGPPVDRTLLGIGCPTDDLCVTGNSVNALFASRSPGAPASAWVPAQGGGSVQITDVDCPSESRCVAVDNNGDVLTSTDPTGGAGAWTFENLLPYASPLEPNVIANAFFGVSCATPSLCVIAGAKGALFASSDPFLAPPAPAEKKSQGKKGKKGKRRKGPKRPRVIIGGRPPLGTEIRGSHTKVRFRFFAAKHASVRGFVCRLDHRPMKPCRSPKNLRVGLGFHTFEVRAVGWTGHRGKPESTGFKICHPTRIGAYCIGAFSDR